MLASCACTTLLHKKRLMGYQRTSIQAIEVVRFSKLSVPDNENRWGLMGQSPVSDIPVQPTNNPNPVHSPQYPDEIRSASGEIEPVGWDRANQTK